MGSEKRDEREKKFMAMLQKMSPEQVEKLEKMLCSMIENNNDIYNSRKEKLHA